MVPRIEAGELAVNDPPTAYRVRRWFSLAPRVSNDIFIKLHTHGTQERNSNLLLGGALQSLFSLVKKEAERQSCEVYFVRAWQMYLAIEALRTRADPVQAIAWDPTTAGNKMMVSGGTDQIEPRAATNRDRAGDSAVALR
jgi:hypothetical protein